MLLKKIHVYIVMVVVFVIGMSLFFGDASRRLMPVVSAETHSVQTDQLNTTNVPPHTQTSNSYEYYFPAVFDAPPPAQFSIGGVGSSTHVDQVVPEAAQIDPYIWDVLPHPESNIQVIRTCTYYRQKISVNDNGTWRWMHAEWYQDFKQGHLCWDPITSQVAKIVKDVNCAFGYGRLCLDVSSAQIANQGESELRKLISENPRWIWMIGNEPDNRSQDALIGNINISDGATWRRVNVGGAEAYAYFFKHIYNLVDSESSVAPRLVFCQATFAHANRVSYGLDYCRQAYEHLKLLDFGPNHIYALSTHQYAHDAELFNGQFYIGGELLDGETQPYGDGRSVLELAVGRWINHLEAFESWAASEGMGHKPLWLTEYGSLAAWCHQAQPDTNYEAGGVACPQADNGSRLYPFYGRNSDEGIWGLQRLQMEYLMRMDNQWKAGWWFVSTMGWGSGICYQTGWLWRADFNCEADSARVNNLSRAGETHLQTLDCLFNQQNCPTPGQRSIEAPPTLSTSSSATVPEPYCKSFGDFICPNAFE